jgi:hypothetical protein
MPGRVHSFIEHAALYIEQKANSFRLDEKQLSAFAFEIPKRTITPEIGKALIQAFKSVADSQAEGALL